MRCGRGDAARFYKREGALCVSCKESEVLRGISRNWCLDSMKRCIKHWRRRSLVEKFAYKLMLKTKEENRRPQFSGVLPNFRGSVSRI